MKSLDPDLAYLRLQFDRRRILQNMTCAGDGYRTLADLEARVKSRRRYGVFPGHGCNRPGG